MNKPGSPILPNRFIIGQDRTGSPVWVEIHPIN
jgi:hypothetical protein